MSLNVLYIVYGLSFCVVILITWIIRLEVKIHSLTRGKSGASLEDSIVDAHKKLDAVAEFRKDSLSYFTDIEKRLSRSIQTVETLRFNPFKGTGDGGTQSFATSFVSEDGRGVVISSLYSRDRISIFSKPLEKFSSPIELTEEEKEVVEKSKKTLAS